jgi:uncharacterized protein YacL
MDFAFLLIIFTACEIITPLLTEGVKNLLDSASVKYASNVVVLFTSLIVSVGVMTFAYLSQNIPFSALNIAYIVVMFFMNWLGSMVGYDKVTQLITQLNVNKK